MMETEIQRYKKLNALAGREGIVIFGNKRDTLIPVGELRQAFSIEQKMYNRSFNDLSIADAIKVFDETIAPLSPESILIHLGDTDIDLFAGDSYLFDYHYRALLNHIKSTKQNCRIAVVSLKNHHNDSQITEINNHLKYIAESEKCEYEDISRPKVWNPQSTMNAISFVYSIGFVHPLKNKRPLHDLVRHFRLPVTNSYIELFYVS